MYMRSETGAKAQSVSHDNKLWGKQIGGGYL